MTGRTVAVAAVVGITMLGNLRLQASEAAQTRRPVQASQIPVSWIADEPRPYGHATVTARGDDARFDAALAPMNDADGVADESDDVQLVPAIYAWNPDVRFVYFRHVSKWM